MFAGIQIPGILRLFTNLLNKSYVPGGISIGLVMFNVFIRVSKIETSIIFPQIFNAYVCESHGTSS